MLGLMALAACRGPNPAFKTVAHAVDASAVEASMDRSSMTDVLPGQGGRPAGSDEHQAPSGGGDAGGQLDAAQDTYVPSDVGPEAGAGGLALDAKDASGGPLCPAGWACIPAGSFTMGSPVGEPGREHDETAHAVTITRPFWLKTTEVTQGQWRALMGDNPSDQDQCGDSCPVENVNWYRAIAFANASSLKDGLRPCYQTTAGAIYDAAAAGRKETPTWPEKLACPGYRLATEAEWEYAARAGSKTAFSAGPITKGTDCSVLEPALAEVGWYCGNSNEGLMPVAGKSPNAWGLYDMHGNVWEWLWDLGTVAADYPEGPATDPLGSPGGSHRRDRGGSYHSNPVRCRAANRDALVPDATYSDTGLRLARSAP